MNFDRTSICNFVFVCYLFIGGDNSIKIAGVYCQQSSQSETQNMTTKTAQITSIRSAYTSIPKSQNGPKNPTIDYSNSISLFSPKRKKKNSVSLFRLPQYLSNPLLDFPKFSHIKIPIFSCRSNETQVGVFGAVVSAVLSFTY